MTATYPLRFMIGALVAVLTMLISSLVLTEQPTAQTGAVNAATPRPQPLWNAAAWVSAPAVSPPAKPRHVPAPTGAASPSKRAVTTSVKLVDGTTTQRRRRRPSVIYVPQF